MTEGEFCLNREDHMRKAIIFLITLVLAFGLTTNVQAASNSPEQPVVNTVLFFTNDCPYCNLLLTKTLPPIQEQYQSQLNILLIEVDTAQEIDSLYSLGGSLGLAKERVIVPLLLIDHTPLVGVDEISQKLPDLVDKYLASGGVEYPDIPLLANMLARGIAYTSSEPYLHLVPAAQVGNASTAQALAWVVMVFMILALLASIVLVVRSSQGSPLPQLNSWLDYAIPVLSFIGLGAAIYLTYVEFTHTRALCGPVGDCNAVQSSSYARLFGVLPVGLVGAVGYIAILVAWLWRRFRSDRLANIAGPGLFGMALFGTLFSIYLTYLELFVIHAVCIWCLSSAVIITVLMLLGLPFITQWLAISDEEEQPVA